MHSTHILRNVIYERKMKRTLFNVLEYYLITSVHRENSRWGIKLCREIRSAKTMTKVAGKKEKKRERTGGEEKVTVESEAPWWQSPFPKQSWQASFLATCIKPFSQPQSRRASMKFLSVGN